MRNTSPVCRGPLAALAASLVFVVACASEPPRDPVQRIDLRAATGLAAVNAVGVTVDPVTGRRFVFDDRAGIYELSQGSATLVISMADLPDPGVSVRLPFTDLVALGDGEFALTAIGDGFLLDVAAGTLAQHFCYEPGFFPEDLEQRTDAVTYDPASDRLYAQPRTYQVDGGEVIAAHVGAYDRVTGDDLQWFALPVDFVAGGMTMIGDELWLGTGTSLHRYDFVEQRAIRGPSLTAFGVGAIDGLATDEVAGTLLVLDGGGAQVVEIDLAELELSAR